MHAAAHIELPGWINDRTVYDAYNLSVMAQEAHDRWFATKGMRAARARDPRLLLALEKGAEVLRRLSETQLGRTFKVDTIRVDASEYQLWREAFIAADAGHPTLHFCWVYGAAAVLAGY